MRHVKIFRTLAIALTLALLAAIVPATPVLAAALVVRPTESEIGDEIEVYGSGFTMGIHYNLYFTRETATPGDSIDTDVNNYHYLGEVTIDVDGSFVDYFYEVPNYLEDGATSEKVRNGTYYIFATYTTYGDTKQIRARTTFTVTGAQEITIDPVDGKVGSEIKVSGTGFAASKSITIKFDGTTVQTATSDSAGSFSNVTFAIPESYRGEHTVEAKDASNNAATATSTTKQAIVITPTSGVAGDTITVDGTGFAASKSVNISFDSLAVATAETNSAGSFQVTFAALPREPGSYDIEAIDADSNSNTGTFTLAVSAINLEGTTGYSGSTVTVSGSGFQAGKELPIVFDNESVATVTTDATGKFSTTFTVPVRAAGTYTVKVSDGTNTAEASFSIATSASISPVTSAASPGHVGTKLTVSGIGFAVGKTVTVTYDGKEIATASVKTDGTFSAAFDAPAGSAGDHSIIASDGTTTKQFTFTMESAPPPTPAPLKPEMDIKAEAETYFDWEDVTDPSGVTYSLQIATAEDFPADSIVLEKTGLTESEYTITAEEKLKSVSKKEPYYWHVSAEDSASNVSEWTGTGSFYVGGFAFALSQKVIYTLFSVGALLLAIFAFWMGRKTAYY